MESRPEYPVGGEGRKKVQGCFSVGRGGKSLADTGIGTTNRLAGRFGAWLVAE